MIPVNINQLDLTNCHESATYGHKIINIGVFSFFVVPSPTDIVGQSVGLPVTSLDHNFVLIS